MMKDKLIKISAEVQKNWRQHGHVEYIVERYADPRKPNLTKLWVVNGEHEFKRNRDCFAFCCSLSDEAGGAGTPSNESWGKPIKTYSEEVYRAAILN